MRTICQILLALFLNVLGGHSALSQFLPSGTYTTKDGLPSNTILSLFQDAGGYLWIGTNNGLSRYDGAQFRNFSTVQGLSNNWITDIAESPKEPGTLWIGTIAGGVNRIRNGTVTVFRLGTDDASNNISSLVADTAGTVWATTYFGLFMIKDERLSRTTQPGIPRAEHLLALEDGTVWLAGDDQLFRHDPHDSLWIPVPLRAGRQAIITEIARCSEGGVWVGYSDGRITRVSGTAETGDPFFSGGAPQRIVDDGRGTLWLKTRSALWSLHTGSPGSLTLVLPAANEHVPRDVIAPLIIDGESNVWLGTWTSGLVKLADRNVTVIAHRSAPGDLSGVSAVSDSTGHVWASDRGGVTEFYADSTATWCQTFHRIPDLGASEGCYTSIADRFGNIWCVTRNGREIRGFSLTPRSGRPSILSPIKTFRRGKDFPEGMLLTLFVDARGRLFISVGKAGVAILDIASGMPVGFMTPADGIPGADVRVVRQDHSGNLWMGGWNDGISVFSSAASSPAFLRTYRTEDGLPDNSIRALHEDRTGVMWVGTRHGGLGRLVGDRFRTTSMAEGLLSNSIWAIEEDGSGTVYLLTDAGIERVSRDSATPLFQRSEFRVPQGGSMGKIGGRYIWYASATDLTIVDPLRHTGGRPGPAVHLLACVVSGRNHPIVQNAEFHYTQNTFTIEYVGISFRDETAVRYQYRLIGADTTWSAPTGQRSITYASLPPGDYAFQVRASLDDDAAPGPIASYAFVIVPPVWQRWWAIAGTLLGALALLVALVRYRLRRILEMERLRVRIAADLHDDVGTNLSSVMLATQIMERKYAVTGDHLADLRRLRTTTERTQEMLRDIVWFLDPGNDSGEDFIMKLKELAARILQDLPCRFDVAGNDAPAHLSLEMKRHVVLIFKESLTNITKHARASSVVIQAVSGNGAFVLSIADDGVGFDTSRESTGNGLTNLRRRAQEAGGSLEVHSALGQGTQIRLSFNITQTRHSSTTPKVV